MSNDFVSFLPSSHFVSNCNVIFFWFVAQLCLKKFFPLEIKKNFLIYTLVLFFNDKSSTIFKTLWFEDVHTALNGKIAKSDLISCQDSRPFRCASYLTEPKFYFFDI